MKATQEQQEQIGAILPTLQCPYDPPCHAIEYESLGRTKFTVDMGILECLETRGFGCAHSLPFGEAIFCMCPLRKYLAEQGIA